MHDDELSYPVCPSCGTATAIRITKELYGWNVELWSYGSLVGHKKLRERATYTHLGARYLAWRWGREIKKANDACVITESNEDVYPDRPNSPGITES